ncbi:MAG: dihydrolipoyl dehydrogenase [Deltaproteobacteria bacterium]|jgi:dihydrolipoamide dehydrogenase|nr:dihydrolipoyl dehydrogenase [Deltaproteobacteria bacterium]
MKVTIVGGGPGGYVAAIRAAQLGAEVSLIEKGKLGGVCLNEGCIPTKALLHAASLYAEVREGARLGVMAEVRLDFAKTQEYKAGVVKRLVNGVSGLLAASKVKVIQGEASFAPGGRLTVQGANGTTDAAFDKLILAAGSVPALPPIPGMGIPQCIDSSGALALASVPASMLIIGGGVIGMEMASLYNALGSRIVVAEMLPDILPMLDGDITRTLRTSLAGKGVEILTQARVMEVKDQGTEALALLEVGGERKEFKVEKILVAAGRCPNTASLNLDAAGLAHERGRIRVNERMETNLPGVYAIGDCNGQIMLAHAASAQGEIAAENALGHSARFHPGTNPSCVYTSPECAGVGLTEEQAKTQGLDYITGTFPLSANGKSLIMNGGKGMIKIIAGRRHKEILGAHLIGPRATDLVAEAALAVGMEATIDEIIGTIHAHPTVAEAFREAALAVDKRAIHTLNK